jgi:hypothetical protein
MQPPEVEQSLIKLNALIMSFDPQLFMSTRGESAKEWRRAVHSSAWLSGISQLFAVTNQVVNQLQAASPVVVMSQFGNDSVPHVVSLAQVSTRPRVPPLCPQHTFVCERSRVSLCVY